ncbi:MAG: hypothetical protein PHI29_13150 [Gallionella sp.]|nr:hypothetical protein [Gallionella sp.]
MSSQKGIVNMRHSKLDKKGRFLDRIIKAQDAGFEPKIPVDNDGKDISKKLSAAWLEKLAACPQCSGAKKQKIKPAPVVILSFATRSGVVKTQGCCADHWAELAETDIGWSVGAVKLETIQASM